MCIMNLLLTFIQFYLPLNKWHIIIIIINQFYNRLRTVGLYDMVSLTLLHVLLLKSKTLGNYKLF